MTRKVVGLSLLVLACLIRFEYAGAQAPPDAWYGRQAKPKDFDAPRVFPGAFSIELPKGWQIVPGHAWTVFSIVEKTRQSQGGALITLEYMRLQAPLDPELIAGAAERELKAVQGWESNATQLKSQTRNGLAGPLILIHYDRPGLSGETDHVVQYSIPAGTTLYRLICIVPSARLDRYRPVFAHVAASFVPTQSAGGD
jgi:hypothetical protein